MKPIPHLHLDFPIPEFFKNTNYRYTVAAIAAVGAIVYGLNLYDYFYRPEMGADLFTALYSGFIFALCCLAVVAATVGPKRYRAPALDLDTSGVLWTRGYLKSRRFAAADIQDIQLDPTQLTLKLRSGESVPVALEGLGWENHQRLQKWIAAYWSKVKRRSSKQRFA